MIKHILLDMDNTIYPASEKMDAGMTGRMKQFIATFLGLSYEEAAALRKKGKARHPTTLDWLIAEYAFSNTEEYYRAIHPENETDELTPDPQLRDFLLSLGLPITLLTNSPAIHAERVLSFYNIQDVFEDIWDMQRLGGRGKPSRFAYETALASTGHSFEETVFVDDYLEYLIPWTEFGGIGIQIDETGHEKELAGERGIISISNIYELKTAIQVAQQFPDPAIAAQHRH